VFQDEVDNLFSSIYQENDFGYGMHIQRAEGNTAQVVPLSVFAGLDIEDLRGLPVVAPGRSQTTRVQALVAGMNLLDGSLNSTFAKRGQISLVGSGEQRAVPAGFEEVRVADPATGRDFIAYRKTNGEDGPWYAADMLEAAQAELASTPAPSAGRIASIFGDIELVRLAFNIFEE
jgi:hypothetical protein